VVGIGLMALCVAAWMLARASLPTRTVAEMLYETERSGDPATKRQMALVLIAIISMTLAPAVDGTP
jgi:hypothetical protein